MNPKNNKRRGHAAEAEAAAIVAAHFPAALHMERTGLDGGHDLRGRIAVGEVKAVRAGPKWLKDLLSQMEDPAKPHHFGFVKLSRGPGRPVRWLAILDVAEIGVLLRARGCLVDGSCPIDSTAPGPAVASSSSPRPGRVATRKSEAAQ